MEAVYFPKLNGIQLVSENLIPGINRKLCQTFYM